MPSQLHIKKEKQIDQIINVEQRFYAFRKSKLLDPIYVTLNIKANTTIVILTTGLEKQDFLFGCYFEKQLNKSELCEQSINLSLKSKVIPNLSPLDRKLFIFSADNLIQQKLDHLVIFVNSHKKPLQITAERYTS